MNNFSKSFSRRSFLAGASSLGALYALSRIAPLAALAQSLPNNPRISQTLLVDKGFASVRKIGNGVYATISDRTKGMQTRSNGGFIVGRDAALLIEGFQTSTGASFQMDALRMVSKVPVRSAINTHWHFDHTSGNTFYSGNGIPIWAHAKAASYIRDKVHEVARRGPQNISHTLGEACLPGQDRQPARARQERHRRSDQPLRARHGKRLRLARPSPRSREVPDEA